MSPFKLRSKIIMLPCLPPEANKWSIWYKLVGKELLVGKENNSLSIWDVQHRFIKHLLFEREFLAIYSTFMNCQLWDLENFVLKCALQWHKSIQLYGVCSSCLQTMTFPGIFATWLVLCCVGYFEVGKDIKLWPKHFSSSLPINNRLGTKFYSQDNHSRLFPCS